MAKYSDILRNHLTKEGEIKVGSKEIVAEFKAELSKIQNAIMDQLFDLGEMLLMINRNYGYSWDNIPFGKMEEIKSWVRRNYFRKTQILSPEMHSALMESENNCGAVEYQDWFNKHENMVN
jgi:uncharacterized protein with HEPN domain